jgi:hypothetical protein
MNIDADTNDTNEKKEDNDNEENKGICNVKY